MKIPTLMTWIKDERVGKETKFKQAKKRNVQKHERDVSKASAQKSRTMMCFRRKAGLIINR